MPEGVKPRGRPPATLELPERRQILRFLHEVTGPAVGLPTLRALFPRIRRAILAELLRRYRRVWRRRLRRSGFQLTWQRPGSAWAMDHSQATQLIDGQYDQIFAVRDLASHRQLAWCAVHSTGADEACRILQSLLETHGAPLILKSDQGSAFVAAAMRQLLQRWQVTPLFSPKRRPQYNGALERANSTHKTYTHQQAVSHGHPSFWTSADLEAARQLSNQITRPWGHQGPSPDEAWNARQAVTAAEREAFTEQLASQEPAARVEQGAVPIGPLLAPQQDRVQRRAISDALESLGYFTKREVRRTSRPRRRRATLQLQRELREQRESPPPADAVSADVDDEPVPHILETARDGDTMRAGRGGPWPHATPDATTPTHRESRVIRFWRAAFTPLIRLAKAANIMR